MCRDWQKKKGDIGITISTHNGSDAHREHNIRDKRVISKEPHIDPKGEYEIWRDEKPRDAYDRLFGDSVRDYNEQQQREDRKINNYYDKIRDSKQQHPVYEIIIQVGSRENPVDHDIGKEILREYACGWNKRNPNLEMIGCYYHNDERGEQHIHIDYIPVAEYDKGMYLRTGLNRALEQQDGFIKNGRETAQIQWERKENACLEYLCKDREIEVEHPERDRKDNQERQQHRATREYKAFKEEQRIDRLERKQQEREKSIKGREKDLDRKEKDIERQEKAYERYEKEVDRYCQDRDMSPSEYYMKCYNASQGRGLYPTPEAYNPMRDLDRKEIERIHERNIERER
ncbi:MAG: hypothetical protein Q4E24_16315 [bacterium]|nr:hypothetical protein [bacterium]